jgi:hypothetical protein
MTIARALAQASVYYKRSALLAGLFGLAAVSAVMIVEQTLPKGVLIALGLIFAVMSYRSLRKSASFVDPAGSPVLRAMTESPDDIAKVWVEQAAGKPCYVVVQERGGAQLAVRIEPDRVEAEVAPLLAAIEARSPNAEVVRRGSAAD